MVNKQLKREIDQYRIEEDRPSSKINYNYNIQVTSNKDIKGKNIEKSKTMPLPGRNSYL